MFPMVTIRYLRLQNIFKGSILTTMSPKIVTRKPKRQFLLVIEVGWHYVHTYVR